MDPTRTYVVDPGAAVLVADLGIDVGNVLRRAGLPLDLFSRAPVALTPADYFALWEALEEESGDPALPLTIGRAISTETFAPPIFAALCSRNLNLAASRIARYKRLIGPLRLIVSETSSATTIRYRWPDTDPHPPHVLELADLIFWVALARLGTRQLVQPIEVRSTNVPVHGDAYRDYFGVPVKKANHPSVRFSAVDAARPFLTANEGMWRFFEPELRRRLDAVEAGASMSDRVRSALIELLPAGSASVDAVARTLAVSTRTLQRRLKEEGGTFQSVLDRTRESLARHYLEHADLPVAEISFLLGYEDATSFHRAFRSWTGETPGQVRSGG